MTGRGVEGQTAQEVGLGSEQISDIPACPRIECADRAAERRASYFAEGDIDAIRDRRADGLIAKASGLAGARNVDQGGDDAAWEKMAATRAAMRSPLRVDIVVSILSSRMFQYFPAA